MTYDELGASEERFVHAADVAYARNAVARAESALVYYTEGNDCAFRTQATRAAHEAGGVAAVAALRAQQACSIDDRGAAPAALVIAAAMATWSVTMCHLARTCGPNSPYPRLAVEATEACAAAIARAEGQ